MIETPIVRIEEIATLMKSRKKSITYENKIYRGSISSKENVASLADKHEMAMCRPEYVVNGLTASPQIPRGYNQSIKQYIEQGYMRKSQEQEQSESESNLPQVPVIMPDKDSTEKRIVIDTSTKMDGLSLNGAMHKRPNLQRRLFDELLRFSRSSVVVVCGIAEIYLRIGSVPADKPCQYGGEASRIVLQNRNTWMIQWHLY